MIRRLFAKKPLPSSFELDDGDFIGPIDDGLVVFCRRATPTKSLDLMGMRVVAAIDKGMDRSRFRARVGRREVIAGAFFLTGCFALFLRPASSLFWLVLPASCIAFACWQLRFWLSSLFAWGGARREPTLDELLALTNTEDQRFHVRAFDEYRRLLVGDPTSVMCELRDGSRRSLYDDELLALSGDHGRQLLLHNDRSGWPLVRRPLPPGRLIVQLRGRRAKTLLSSKWLMLERNDKTFNDRIGWIEAQALLLAKGTKALRNALPYLRYLRTKRLAGTALKDVIDELGHDDPQLKPEMVQKLWSGNHADFEKALKRLPLESMP